MTWLAFCLGALVAALVLFLPGLGIGVSAGLRRLPLIAIAPALTACAAALGAILAAKIGVAWGPLPLLLFSLVLAGVSFLASWLTKRIRGRLGFDHLPTRSASEDLSLGFDSHRRLGWWTLAAAGVAAVLMTRQLVVLLGRPDAFSQTWDNIFHLNAVRWILETGNGSSATFDMITNGQAPTFYPLAFHDLAAVVLKLLGSTQIAFGMNSLIWACMALAWPVGTLYLVRVVVGRRPLGILACGVLTTACTAFPLLLLRFGVLYPNFLGLCLLPALVALTASLFGFGAAERLPTGPAVIAGLIAIMGLALAHPNVLMTYLVMFVVPIVVWWALLGVRGRYLRRISTRAAIGRWVLAAATLACVAVLFMTIRPAVEDMVWSPVGGNDIALGQAMMLAPLDSGFVAVVAALALVGLYATIRTRRHLWLLWCDLMILFFWRQAVVLHRGDLRNFWVGIWYTDNYRLAALLPLTALPLAVVGVLHLADVVSGLSTRMNWPRHRPAWMSSVLTCVVAALLIATTQWSSGLQNALAGTAGAYRVDAQSNLVSSDELTLIREIPSVVPPDQRIATNPWNGSSMVYGLTGRETTTTHVTYDASPDLQLLRYHLDSAASMPQVCSALKDLNVHWVLDFGDREVLDGDHHDYSGFEQLSSSLGFVPVLRVNDKVLYQITACNLG